MEKTNKKKRKDEISFEIQTNFGKLSGSFDFDDIQKKYVDEFEDYVQVSNGHKYYFFATELAEDLLKELLPQILEDALNQVWLEAKAKTLNILNNKPCFLDYESTGNNRYETIEVISLPKNEIKEICLEIAENAKSNSLKRIQTERLFVRGGNRLKKLSNYDYFNLDNFYDFYYLQAKSVLNFHKWKKEQWESESRSNKGDEKWKKDFLEIMFQATQKGNDFLFEKLDNPELSKKEKAKYESILNSQHTILHYLNSYEIELWKKTFRSILTDNSNSQEVMTFELLTPEKLTYHYLVTIFEDKYKIEFNHGTLENEVKTIRRIKKVMLKE